MDFCIIYPLKLLSQIAEYGGSRIALRLQAYFTIVNFLLSTLTQTRVNTTNSKDNSETICCMPYPKNLLSPAIISIVSRDCCRTVTTVQSWWLECRYSEVLFARSDGCSQETFYVVYRVELIIYN